LHVDVSVWKLSSSPLYSYLAVIVIEEPKVVVPSGKSFIDAADDEFCFTATHE